MRGAAFSCLALPTRTRARSMAGIAVGPIMALAFYGFVCISMHLMGKAQNASDASTYQGLVRAALGTKARAAPAPARNGLQGIARLSV